MRQCKWTIHGIGMIFDGETTGRKGEVLTDPGTIAKILAACDPPESDSDLETETYLRGLPKRRDGRVLVGSPIVVSIVQ